MHKSATEEDGWMYRVIDLKTGEQLQYVVEADDTEGWCIEYLLEDDGAFKLADDGFTPVIGRVEYPDGIRIERVPDEELE